MNSLSHLSGEKKIACDFCYDILIKVSRTFAISIYRLDKKLKWPILIAYLLCRIVDTIEDDNQLTPKIKNKLFDLFIQILQSPQNREKYVSEFQKTASQFLKPQYKDYLILCENVDKVMSVFITLSIQQQQAIQKWTLEMAKGMQKITQDYPKGVKIQTLKEYYEYCFYVAGTVGYLLTDLWQKNNKKLELFSQDFANGLQSVNILKDIANDYYQEKNIYLPEELFKKHQSTQTSICDKKKAQNNNNVIQEIIVYTEQNLENAFKNYYCQISKLRLSYFSIRHFCIVPLFYAFATLNLLKKKKALFFKSKNSKD